MRFWFADWEARQRLTKGFLANKGGSVLRLRRTGRTQIIAESQANGGFSLADIHVSLLSRKNTRGQARSRERAILGQDLQLASVPLGFGPCLRRT